MQAGSMASVFVRLLSQLPVYLVWLAGAVLAVVRWRQHPRASLLAVIGLGMLFVSELVGTIVNSALPLILGSGATFGDHARMSGLLGAYDIVFAAVGYGLLLAAVFSGRSPQPAVEKES